MKHSGSEKALKPRGRPRGFDRNTALDRVVEVFTRDGFEGATVAEICRVTRLNPPSLYAAFGDKQALFEAALDRYQAETGVFAVKALAEEPTARAAIERLLTEAAGVLANPERPWGCLVVTGALACGDRAARGAASERRLLSQNAIRERIALGAAAGEFEADENVDGLARYVVSVFQGMSVQARDGATAEQLREVAARAIRAWPA